MLQKSNATRFHRHPAKCFAVKTRTMNYKSPFGNTFKSGTFSPKWNFRFEKNYPMCSNKYFIKPIFETKLVNQKLHFFENFELFESFAQVQTCNWSVSYRQLKSTNVDAFLKYASFNSLKYFTEWWNEDLEWWKLF